MWCWIAGAFAIFAALVCYSCCVMAGRSDEMEEMIRARLHK